MPDHVAGLPRPRGVERAHRHQVQAQRVGAVGVVHVVGRHAVLEALAHLAPLARDGSAVVGEPAVALDLDVGGVDVDVALVLVGGGQHVALVEQPGVRLASTTGGRGRTAPCARSGRTAGAARRARRRRRRGRRHRDGPVARRSAGPSSSARSPGRRSARRWSGRSSAARTSTSRPTAASRWCRGGTAAGRRRGRASTSTQSSTRSSGLSGSENSSSGSNVRGEKLSVSGSSSGSMSSGSSAGWPSAS